LGSRLVEEGLAASLARPGGNVTGLVLTDRELIGKHLALVKEIAPTTSRIGVLFNPNGASSRAALPELQSAAQAMNVRLQPREVTRPEEVEPAFKNLVRQHAEAIVVIAANPIYEQRQLIADLAVRHKMAAISEFIGFAEAGFLA